MIDTIPSSAIVAASGAATIRWYVRSGQRWQAQQVSIDAPDVGGSASCAVYIDDRLISPAVPQADAVSGEPFIPVRRSVEVRWTASVVGAVCRATLVYDDGQTE